MSIPTSLITFTNLMVMVYVKFGQNVLSLELAKIDYIRTTLNPTQGYRSFSFQMCNTRENWKLICNHINVNRVLYSAGCTLTLGFEYLSVVEVALRSCVYRLWGHNHGMDPNQTQIYLSQHIVWRFMYILFTKSNNSKAAKAGENWQSGF